MAHLEIKHQYTGEVLYSGEAQSIKELLEKALKKNSNLENSDLRYANLENSDLRYADLENSDLRYANLRNADLRYTNLGNSDLRYADLENSNLENSDLRYADLENANLENSIKTPMSCKWSHGITNENLIHIGCEKRTIDKWDVFFASKETLSTSRNTPAFKQIEAVYLAYKAYLTHLKS